MPMHTRTATAKGGKRYRWDKTGADALNLFVSLYFDDYDGKTKSEIWHISPFHNYNKQGFFKTLIATQKCVDLFPCGFSDEGFRTRCLQGIDARQGEGAAHSAIAKAEAGRDNNTNNINKVTPRKSTRTPIKPLNPRSPPSPDTDYVSSDDETYDFRAELDDITVLTSSVTLESKETAVASLLRNGAFKDCPFEESDEEETDDDISVLSQEEPVESPGEEIMSIRYKYSVFYPNDIIQVTVFYITGCAPSFYIKNKNEVIMVETTPRIVYDAMGVYYKQGYDAMNGHVMLLQAEMDRKRKQRRKRCPLRRQISVTSHPVK
jgi:hypothetical protein